jgi:hypothetical protein
MDTDPDNLTPSQSQHRRLRSQIPVEIVTGIQ